MTNTVQNQQTICRVPVQFKYLAGNSIKPWNTDGTAQCLVSGSSDAAIVVLEY